ANSEAQAVRFAKQIFLRLRKNQATAYWRKSPKFVQREEFFCIDVERRTGAQERLSPMCNLLFPKKRPISAPNITVAMIAAPCAPSECHGVENGHAIRQPALIARPAPAPDRAPATVGRVASELRNTKLKNRTRIPRLTRCQSRRRSPRSMGPSKCPA